jgi:hypothetical protein
MMRERPWRARWTLSADVNRGAPSGLIIEALIGRRAKAVLDLVSCDILLVRNQATSEGETSNG